MKQISAIRIKMKTPATLCLLQQKVQGCDIKGKKINTYWYCSKNKYQCLEKFPGTSTGINYVDAATFNP